MANPGDNRRDRQRQPPPPLDRGRADDRLIDSNKPTQGQAEGERDPAEQSAINRDEGERSDREGNL